MGILRGERIPSARASTLPHNSLRIDLDEGRRYAALVEIIRREVPADEAILAVPSNAELYFLSQRRNGFRFYNTALGVRTDAELAAVEQSLRDHPPQARDVQPGRQVQHVAVAADHGDGQAPLCSPRPVRSVRRVRAAMMPVPATTMTSMAEGQTMSTSRTLVSVVLPSYNEEAALPLVVASIAAAAPQYNVEILIVDDGSTDGTWRQIQRLRKAHPGVRGLRFTRNFGHQAAILAGLLAATGRRGDRDGRRRAASARRSSRSSSSAGARDIRSCRPSARPVRSARPSGFFSRLFYRVLHALSGVDVPAGSADFRLLGRPVVAAVLQSAGHLLFLRGLVPYLGYETAYVPFTAPPRIAGRTSYTWRKMVQLSLDGLMSFSIVPLRRRSRSACPCPSHRCCILSTSSSSG